MTRSLVVLVAVVIGLFGTYPGGSAPATDYSPGIQSIREFFDQTYKNRAQSYLRSPASYRTYTDTLVRFSLSTPDDVKEGSTRPRLLDVGCGPGLLLEQAALQLRSGLGEIGFQ